LVLSLGAVAAGVRNGERKRQQAETIPPALPPGPSRAATAWDVSNQSPWRRMALPNACTHPRSSRTRRTGHESRNHCP
jgi:hypothetical protein